MIKLKDLLKEWNDTSFKKLPKRWSKDINETDGLTELERLELDEDLSIKESGVDGRIYKWKEEMKAGKFDPENPTVHLIGYGTGDYKFLQKSVASDLMLIAKELKRGDVSKAYHHLIGNDITVWKVKCLEDVRKELKTSVWKRRITMYKNKKQRAAFIKKAYGD
jgi:predicted Mrr-cat superfamily restriction endonuclease